MPVPRCSRRSSRTRPRRRSRTSTSPGTTTWRPASRSTASSSRNRVIVAHRDPPADDRRRAGPVVSATPTSSATSPGPAGTTSARWASAASSTARQPDALGSGVPRRLPVAHRVVRRHRHHRAPPPAVLLPRDRLRSAAPSRTSRCSGPSTTARPSRTRARGRGATPSSSWSWAGHEGAPVTVEVYADADEVELLVERPSLGRQPAGAEHRFRAEFETVYEPGELEAVAWRGRRGDRPHAAALGDRSGAARRARPTGRRSAPTHPTSPSSSSTLVDGAGTLSTAADRRVAVEVDGPGVLQGLGSANPCTEKPSPKPRARPSTGARSPSSGPPAPERSPRGHRRRMRTGASVRRDVLIVSRR